ncbi:MAG: hypothetical protein OXT65_02740 [Alphaproteobacteria bacterium]|nr:hypothetical protein [Alphaproteobacteria bacterium]
MARIILSFILCLFLAAPALAQMPSQESLKAAWEHRIRTDENTVRLKETETEGVYDFKTLYFPYEGSLRVLNHLVTKDSYMQTPDGRQLYSGIVEIELTNAPKDFFAKYAYSYAAFQRGNQFYYDPATQSWFAQDAWTEHFSNAAAGQQSNYRCPLPSTNTLINIVLILAALTLLFLVLAVAKRGKKAMTDQDTMMARQKRGLEIAEENTALIRAQIRILEDIRAALDGQEKNDDNA